MSNDYDFVVLEEKRKPNVYAISSLCEDGSHVIFWDFDINHDPKNIYKIEKSLSGIQRNFLLSKIYVFQSRNGYNAICLDKVDKSTACNVKNLTAYDDKKHLEQGILYNWKLRIGEDKKYITYVDVEKFSKFTKSNSHRIALNKMFGMSIEKDIFFDNSINICLYSYWDWKTHVKNELTPQALKNYDRQEDEFTYTNR